jgi:hypothetical protein
MGGGKGSSSSTPVVTEEQKELLRQQTGFLTNTAYPAYQRTIGQAGDVYNQVNPAVTDVAQTAMDVSGRSGALQEAAGSRAYGEGLTGQSGLAGYQSGAGQGLFAGGAGQLGEGAGYQRELGRALTGQGAGQLGALFSPQYKQEQIQASLQPAREEIREQMGQQSAMFGGAGGLGSSRQALASRNLASLGEQRMGSVAAQTSAGVESQRQRAAESFLGAGQTATGQAQSGYSQLMGAGSGALGQAGSLYGSLTGAGQQGLSAAQQSAASRIGFAGAPQDVLSKYASVIYGTPQASTTPNFAGTQGQQTSSKGFGF